jgi:hydrogenase maturation protease
MTSAVTYRIALLGLGNLMRTDDAFGMLTLERLARDNRLPEGVRIVEGGTLGLDLLDSLRDITHVLAIDAVETGAAPGTLVKFADEEMANLPISKSVHLLGFSDLLGVLRLMDCAPAETVLLGVQPESTDWGTVPTPKVAAAQDQIVELALEQINVWMKARSLHQDPIAPASKVF